MTDKIESISILILAAFSLIGAISLALFFLNISFVISILVVAVYFVIIHIMTRDEDEHARRTK